MLSRVWDIQALTLKKAERTERNANGKSEEPPRNFTIVPIPSIF
jgi:hypothetical protein